MAQSKLYTGNVKHKRLEPFHHSFRYGVFMTFLDLDEADKVIKNSWLYSTNGRALVEFRRSDYHGDPAVPLADAIRDLVLLETGVQVRGPIRMLTNLRVMGHVFNPVTFYYCYDQTGSHIEHIIAEITNTPWKERHAYVLSPEKNLSEKENWYIYHIDKEFHVSPFLDLNYQHEMQFCLPHEKLVVSIANNRGAERKFIATLTLQEEELTTLNLMKQLVKFPFITLKVVWGIYWQALVLRMKGATFYPHPGGLKSQLHKERT